jgi:hypothetical protein
MPLYSVLLFLFLFFFSGRVTPSLPLRLIVASIPPAQSEAVGGGWRAREACAEGGWVGAVGEEGEPRERLGELSKGGTGICCNPSLASRPRCGCSFPFIGIQFHVKLLSFRLDNRIGFHSESFFVSTLSTMYSFNCIFIRRLRLHLISSHFDSTRLAPFHTSSLSPLSISAHFH